MSDELAVTMPCGCRRGITKRMAPDIDENGHPKLQDGAFVMKEVEELQERYCDEHTRVLAERQQEAHRALEAGASADEVMGILTGTSMFSLTDGTDSRFLTAEQIEEFSDRPVKK